MAKKKTSKKKSIPTSTKKIFPTKEQKKEIVEMVSMGWPLEKVSLAIGWGKNELFNQLKKDADLARSVKGAKFRATHKVVNALFQSATGYSHPETKFISVSDGMQSGSHVETFETEKHYPPNYNSARLWLMNSAPDMFQDEKAITVKMDTFTDEEIEEMALKYLAEEESKDDD